MIYLCIYTISHVYTSLCLPNQLRNVLKMEHPVNNSCYSKRKLENKRVDSLWKLSGFYTTEFMDSYFHLCRRGYHHGHVDVDALASGIADDDEDPVVFCI
jgi:hypothetical protein